VLIIVLVCQYCLAPRLTSIDSITTISLTVQFSKTAGCFTTTFAFASRRLSTAELYLTTFTLASQLVICSFLVPTAAFLNRGTLSYHVHSRKSTGKFWFVPPVVGLPDHGITSYHL